MNRLIFISFFFFVACKTRNFDATTTAHNSAADVKTGWAYTTMGEATKNGENLVTEIEAHVEMGIRRFAMRKEGFFGLKSSSSSNDEYVSMTSPKSTLVATCQGDICSFSGKILSTIYEEDAAVVCDTKPTQIVSQDPLVPTFLKCTKRNQLHWVAIYRLPQADITNCVRPVPYFEFFRSGPVFGGDGQCLWKVPAGKKIRFGVAKELKSDPIFISAMQVAFDYWNKTIGREIFDSELDEHTNFAFDPKQSIIHFNPEKLTTIASAGSLANPLNGEIISMRMQVNGSYKNNPAAAGWTFTHELGHALGLAHNFAGSVDAKNFQQTFSTTVMDYVHDMDVKEPLPYDVAAMAYIYTGKMPSEKFIHCNDIQVGYRSECTRFESQMEATPVLATVLNALSTPELVSDLWAGFRGLYSEGEKKFFESLDFNIDKPIPTRKALSGMTVVSIPFQHWALAYRAYWFDSTLPTEQKATLRAAAEQFATALLTKNDLTANEKALIPWMKHAFEKPIFDFRHPSSQTVSSDGTIVPEPTHVDQVVRQVVKKLKLR